MIKGNSVYDVKRLGFTEGTLKNNDALVSYNPLLKKYIAIDLHWYYDIYSTETMKSTIGDFKRCKKAFDKYTNSHIQ